MDVDSKNQVNILQRHMGGIVQILSELQSKVKILEEKDLNSKKDSVKKEKLIEQTILSNKNVAIKRRDRAIVKIKKDDKENKPMMDSDNVENDAKVNRKGEMCRYFNF